jgi:hypothetical protein
MALAQSPSGRPGDRPHRLARACRSVVPWRVRRRLPHATGSAPRAIDWHARRGMLGVARACKFLFFPRRRSSAWSTRPFAPPSCVALQHSLVNINENTSAAFSTGGLTAPEPTELPRENGAHQPVRCNTSCRKTSQTTGGIQAGTRGRGTWGGPIRRHRHAARLSLRLPPAVIVDRRRSLLIARIPGAAEPVRSGDRPVRRHGHAPPPPPPSAREESGERP